MGKRGGNVTIVDSEGGNLGEFDGGRLPVDATGSVVTGPLTDAQLRAEPVAVTGATSPYVQASIYTWNGGKIETDNERLRVSLYDSTGTGVILQGGQLEVRQFDSDGNDIVQGLTDTQLRATPVPISGSVTATTGGLTDTQLRATPVPVSGTVTASGPLTDTQLRATAVPVSGTVSATVSGTVDVLQDVRVDANNSSTTQLAAGNGYAFTGAGSSTLGVNAIQVCVFADKDLIVKVQQDATNAWTRYREDAFYYTANSRGPVAGFTVQAVDAYVRVLVTSRTETTTTFRLDTVLCPVVEALPRSLDANGNLRVSLQGDERGNGPATFSPNNELLITPRYRLVGTQFDGATVDGNFWSTSVSTGTVAQAGAEVTITSGTASPQYARLYSNRRARFVTGATNVFRCHLRLGDTGTANAKRRWGVAWGATMPTITDGAWFQLDGTTFSVVTCRGTVESVVSSGAFNGYTGYTYTPTTSNTVFEIIYGNGSVLFLVGGRLLHKVTASTATWSNTLNLHCWSDVSNSGASAAVSHYIRTMHVARIGQLSTQQMSYYFPAGQTLGVTLKYGAGNLSRMILLSTTNNSVITIYDNTAASGTVLFAFTASTTTAAAPSTIDLGSIPFSTGLSFSVASANSALLFVYE